MKNWKNSFYNFFKTYKAPLLSGLLFGCSFIPFPFGILFIALVPLWLFMCQQNSLKKILVGCLLCQFLSTFIGFNWMIYTFHHFGGMNWFLSFIFLLGFCFVANLYVIFSGVLWFILTKKSSVSLPISAQLLLLPLIFSLMHKLTPTIFQWNMGYPWFWGGLPGAQTAELWGFRFIDTLFYVFNLLFLILYVHLFDKNERRKSRKIFFFRIPNIRFDKTAKIVLSGIIFLFLGLNGLGFYLKKRLPQPDEFLNVIIIQNNIGSIAHLKARSFKASKKKALYNLKNLTYRSLKKYARTKDKRKEIDFILWPEGSYSYTINKKRKRERNLSRMVRGIQIPLITGAVSRDSDKYSNSLFVFNREGNILKPVYDKMILLIFGEYFPGIDRFPFLRKLFPYFGSNLIPGKNLQVQSLENVRLGWQICYESLFDWISRGLAKKQAQVLVNITNDSWYGSWQEPLQHLTINFARAIEVRRPLIRSTNTGYSGVVRADGTLDKVMPLNKAWFRLYKVPYYKNPPKTLFMSWGYYINEMFLFVLTLIVFMLSFRIYYKKSQK